MTETVERGRGRPPKDAADGNVRLQLRTTAVLKDGLVRYLEDINSNSLGATTSQSSLINALLRRHLIEMGFLTRRGDLK